MTRRFILLDRDGTLNRNTHYLSDPAEMELLPGVGAALARLQEAGYGLVVVTNQSGIARGYFDEARLAEINARMEDLLAEFGVRLDGIEYCPHGPQDDCACRKPGTVMVERAAQRLGFDPAESVVVGDSPCDMGLARALGAASILLSTIAQKTGSIPADANCPDMTKAAAEIMRRWPVIIPD